VPDYRFVAVQDVDKQRALKKDVDMAEHNYLALHTQLLEDLPLFCDSGLAFFQR
jgi:hypothetical protein